VSSLFQVVLPSQKKTDRIFDLMGIECLAKSYTERRLPMASLQTFGLGFDGFPWVFELSSRRFQFCLLFPFSNFKLRLLFFFNSFHFAAVTPTRSSSNCFRHRTTVDQSPGALQGTDECESSRLAWSFARGSFLCSMVRRPPRTMDIYKGCWGSPRR